MNATSMNVESSGPGTLKNTVDAVAAPVRLAVRVFVVFIAIYLCTWAGHYTSGDGSYKIAWANAMLRSQTAAPAPNGVYSKYGIGHSLIAVPFLATAHAIQRTTGIKCEAALYTLIFVLNGALLMALVAFYLGHSYPPRAIWTTVLIMGLATIWWPYTKLDFSEPLVLTLAFLGFLLVRFGHPFWGLLAAGFTLSIRSDAIAIVLPIVIWYLIANSSARAILRTSIALAPSVALVLFANYIRYHSIFDLGYSNERFSNSFLAGLYGILLSAGKSMFLFSPPLILGVVGWRYFAHQRESRSDAWLFLSICGSQVLLFAKWWDWSSDDAWGVRFVIPGAILMCIPMVTIAAKPILVVPVAVCGLAVQLVAVAVGGLDYELLVRSEQARRNALFVGGANRVDFEDVRFNPRYSQLAGSWILLRHLLGVPPGPGKSDDAERVGTPLYDTMPPQAWRAAAHWDFVWNLRRSSPSRVHSPSIPSAGLSHGGGLTKKQIEQSSASRSPEAARAMLK